MSAQRSVKRHRQGQHARLCSPVGSSGRRRRAVSATPPEDQRCTRHTEPRLARRCRETQATVDRININFSSMKTAPRPRFSISVPTTAPTQRGETVILRPAHAVHTAERDTSPLALTEQRSAPLDAGRATVRIDMLSGAPLGSSRFRGPSRPGRSSAHCRRTHTLRTSEYGLCEVTVTDQARARATLLRSGLHHGYGIEGTRTHARTRTRTRAHTACASTSVPRHRH